MTTAMEVEMGGRQRWKLALANPKVRAGALILALFIVLLVVHPLLRATIWQGGFDIYDPVNGYDRDVSHPSPPSAAHWLGTSSLGRDVFSMLTYATGPTLTVAVTAGAAILLVSLMAGSVAAYRRGWIDGVVSHLSDAMVLLPAMLAVFILGIGRPNEAFGPLQVGLSFGLVYGLGPATATVRAAALTVIAKPFMDAARLAGGGGLWVTSHHMLPHLVPHAGVQAMIGVTGAIIAEAFLSFRSAVGADVGLGQMVYDGITWSFIFSGIAPIPWWIMIAGAGGITLLAAAFYLIGVGMREAFDPKAGGPSY